MELFRTLAWLGPRAGAALGDLQAMIDPEVRKTIEEEHIILTTWRELKERRDKVGGKGQPTK